MKTTLIAFAFTLLPGFALAGGNHAGDHAMAIGEPSHAHAARSVTIVMKENMEGQNTYVFDQQELVFAAGETVRLQIINAGEEVHEFVMDTFEANAKHKLLMEKFPEMEHDDPNAVRLEPGQEAEIIWTFGKPGMFEFACLLPGHYDGGMHGRLIVN